jgi:hypothetical protein
VCLLLAQPQGGWYGINETTGRVVQIESARRLRLQLDWSRLTRLKQLRANGAIYEAANSGRPLAAVWD